jgi:uncharacterized protein (DUF1330 family)
MAKGYWVAQMDIHDSAAYDRYKAKNGVAFAEFGGRFVVRGGQQAIIEGAGRARTVLIEFPSYQAALDCYHSESYKVAMAERAGASTGDLVIVEGYDA